MRLSATQRHFLEQRKPPVPSYARILWGMRWNASQHFIKPLQVIFILWYGVDCHTQDFLGTTVSTLWPGYCLRYCNYAAGWWVQGSTHGGRKIFSPHPSRPALTNTQPPLNGTGALSQGYSGRVVAWTTHSHLRLRFRLGGCISHLPCVPSWYVI